MKTHRGLRPSRSTRARRTAALPSPAMRASALLLACLVTAGAAAVPPPAPETPAAVDAVPLAPPEDDALYSPQTEATIEWLDDVEAARVAAKAADPPIAPVTLEAPLPGLSRSTGIHRCVGSDGNALFTDRECADMGAVDAPPPGAVGGNSPRFAARTCARTRTALLDGVREALDAGDANRLASYYHWSGMGTRAAYALMDRLHGFAQRPLVDVQLVRSAPREPFAMDGDVPPLWSPLLPAPEIAAPPPRPRLPVLVRVDQMRGNKDVAAEVTYFQMTSNAGCWWIHY
jgi:hypothetical protein